jgi:hypothetical protein
MDRSRRIELVFFAIFGVASGFFLDGDFGKTGFSVETTGGQPFLKARSRADELEVCCDTANGIFWGS